jgi:DNA-binding CsgD family transcriptional regulator
VADEGMGHAASGLQRGAIAVLDPDGNVTRADDAWVTGDGANGLPPAPIGTNLLEAYRGREDPTAQAVANAIVAILEGNATYFEIESRASKRGRSFLTSVAMLHGDGAAAVVVHRAVSGRAPHDVSPPIDVHPRRGRAIADAVDRLTPRERQVLDLMAGGLDNRAIAAKLRIEYTTVRGHVRSVIEKLGARSRLEAVARAYQGGWVSKE